MRPRAGDSRPCAAFALCAAEPCDGAAVTERLHSPGDGCAVWVPFCEHHAADPAGVEYVVEVHGFIGGRR